jgi:hypothetical protein
MQLAPLSTEFFMAIKTNNEAVFQYLIQDIQSLLQQGSFLKEHHIDTAIDVLVQQRALPADLLQKLDEYLIRERLDMDSVIQPIRAEKLPWLAEQAKLLQFSHHNMYHAAEMKERTSLIAKQLGLFTQGYASDDFVKAVLRFAIECHDYIQRRPGLPVSSIYATAEQESAAEVIQWLNQALPDAPSVVHQTIRFLVSNAIPLATTLIWGQKFCDLSELFFLIEKRAIEAGMTVVAPSNQLFINDTHAMNIGIGVCDVFAGAFPCVCEEQFKEPRTNTISRLQTAYSALVLDQFFASTAFQPYYQDRSRDENKFMLLMLFVAHLHMRVELSVTIPSKKSPDEVIPFEQYQSFELVTSLIEFIREHQSIYRHMLMRGDSESDFIEFFHGNFEKNEDVFLGVKNIFFSAIDKEASFCNGLTHLLAMSQSKLQALGYIDEHARILQEVALWRQQQTIAPQTSAISLLQEAIEPRIFIDAGIAEKDAFNLAALSAYFHSLELKKEEQQQLVKELLLSTIVTPGVIYVAHLTTRIRSSSFIVAYTPHVEERSSSANFARTAYSSFSHDSFSSQRSSSPYGIQDSAPSRDLDAELDEELIYVDAERLVN